MSGLRSGDIAKVEELLAFVDRLGPGERPGICTLGDAVSRATGRQGDAAAIEPAFMEAEESFSQLGMPFWLAIVRFEHAEWLVTNGRQAEASPMMTLATQEFERLEARPWLDRVRQSARAVTFLLPAVMRSPSGEPPILMAAAVYSAVG